jgi:hypothetical protein
VSVAVEEEVFPVVVVEDQESDSDCKLRVIGGVPDLR